MARLGVVADVCPVLGRQYLHCFDLTLRDLLLSPAAFLAAGSCTGQPPFFYARSAGNSLAPCLSIISAILRGFAGKLGMLMCVQLSNSLASWS